jgi:hypothetical protein
MVCVGSEITEVRRAASGAGHLRDHVVAPRGTREATTPLGTAFG